MTKTTQSVCRAKLCKQARQVTFLKSSWKIGTPNASFHVVKMSCKLKHMHKRWFLCIFYLKSFYVFIILFRKWFRYICNHSIFKLLRYSFRYAYVYEENQAAVRFSLKYFYYQRKILWSGSSLCQTSIWDSIVVIKNGW